MLVTLIRRLRRRTRAALAVLAAAAAVGGLAVAASAATAAPAPARLPSAGNGSPWALPSRVVDPNHDGDVDEQALCSAPGRVNWAACFAVKLVNFAIFKGVEATPATPAGYGPSSLQQAYNLNTTGGAGRTVAIVDAYDDPNAASDLATYRSMYGLPACTTANGCFRKVNQTGGTSYPSANSGWAGEISLDVDMVSAICPNCHILLVEATSASMTNLGTAVNEAVKLGAQYVSNSYGASESPSDTTYDSQYYSHPGVVLTAASGDGGYGTAYPSTSNDVTSVGGTSLTQSSNARGWTETAWSGAGSGCSAYDSKPSWQKDTGCSRRTDTDVSAVADPSTGVAVYDTYGSSGWVVYGGTSVASPIIASVYALAGAPASGTNPASYPYADPSALNDVTSGSNGSCSPAYLCKAGAGYDGPTGLGTPNGLAAFTAPGTGPTPPPTSPPPTSPPPTSPPPTPCPTPTSGSPTPTPSPSPTQCPCSSGSAPAGGMHHAASHHKVNAPGRGVRFAACRRG